MSSSHHQVLSSPPSDVAIRVESLSKCYELFDSPRDRFWQLVSGGLIKRGSDFWALRDVSFAVRRGETFGIVGRNGAGKSTLLQVICGVLRPTLGDVAVNGRVTALLELGAGLNPEFGGLENIRMTAAILGVSQAEAERKLPSIVDFAQLGDFIERPVKLYSSGMMMRLAFSAAINFDPDILVIDEALTVGDELFQLKCLRRIDEIKRKGATILFVSHSMHAINQICDRAVLLDEGRAVFEGPAKQVTERYNKILFAMPPQGVSEADATLPAQLPSKQGTVLRTNPNRPSSSQLGRIEAVGVEGFSHDDMAFNSGEIVTFVANVKFYGLARDVIMGMMITTPTGVDCYHTNLLCRNQMIEKCAAGEEYEVRFTMPLDLGPGGYIAVFDCQYDMSDSPKLVDIFYEALHFRVSTSALIEDGGIAALRAEICYEKAA
jgi:lipopolysaccharide transport system ATP-binding protein